MRQPSSNALKHPGHQPSKTQDLGNKKRQPNHPSARPASSQHSDPMLLAAVKSPDNAELMNSGSFDQQGLSFAGCGKSTQTEYLEVPVNPNSSSSSFASSSAGSTPKQPGPLETPDDRSLSDNSQQEPPCLHNNWDNARVTKRVNVTLRCRDCDTTWKMHLPIPNLCPEFHDRRGTCSLGPSCPFVHVHRYKARERTLRPDAPVRDARLRSAALKVLQQHPQGTQPRHVMGQIQELMREPSAALAAVVSSSAATANGESRESPIQQQQQQQQQHRLDTTHTPRSSRGGTPVGKCSPLLLPASAPGTPHHTFQQLSPTAASMIGPYYSGLPVATHVPPSPLSMPGETTLGGAAHALHSQASFGSFSSTGHTAGIQHSSSGVQMAPMELPTVTLSSFCGPGDSMVHERELLSPVVVPALRQPSTQSFDNSPQVSPRCSPLVRSASNSFCERRGSGDSRMLLPPTQRFVPSQRLLSRTPPPPTVAEQQPQQPLSSSLSYPAGYRSPSQSSYEAPSGGSFSRSHTPLE